MKDYFEAPQPTNFYLMQDADQPGVLKWGEARILSHRLSSYNCGKFEQSCSYLWTAEVPPGFRDTDYLHRFAELGEWNGKECFRGIDEDAAVELADAIVDEIWEKYDPDFVARVVEAHEIDDADWETVEIGQLSPEAADLILERFKAA